MKAIQTNLFASNKRLQMNESIELTIQSLNAYGPKYNYWCMAWSGGKDMAGKVRELRREAHENS